MKMVKCILWEVNVVKKSQFKKIGIFVAISTVAVLIGCEYPEKGKSENKIYADPLIIENSMLNKSEIADDEIQRIYCFGEEESYLLCKIAMAEAEGEDTYGKALVMNVVINRMHSLEFPDLIEEIIYQENQFSPLSNGRWERSVPDEDCIAALRLVEYGWDESGGALYFESGDAEDSWHMNNLEFVKEYGGHKFYK